MLAIVLPWVMHLRGPMKDPQIHLLYIYAGCWPKCLPVLLTLIVGFSQAPVYH